MSKSEPTPTLNFTGERFAPEVTGAIWYEHWHRYCAVQSLAKGLTVLDAACGEGYGSYLLAQTAKDVVGVDIAAEAIAHAKSRYAEPNLRYVEGSCTSLPLPDASFDLVVSFETIEHLWDQAGMLAEFRRVLVPGGALVISSPNQPVYSEFGAHVNDFHVRELTREELAALLDPGFPQQSWYAQRIVAHSALWAESGAVAAPGKGGKSGKSALLSLNGRGVRSEKAPGPPMYFVVVCGAAEAHLPALPPLSLFDDGRQSLYTDYTRALLREKQLYWEQLEARKIAEDRLAELIAITNELASERQKSAALRDRVAAAEEAYREQSTTLPARIKNLEAAFDAAQAELAVEREFSASLTWEERNQRNIAEQRLAELITTVNTASSEREKATALAARVESLEATLAAREADLTAERDKSASLVWEERNWRTVADDRLAELITTVNALSSEREKSATLAARADALAERVDALMRASDIARSALADADRERSQIAERLAATEAGLAGARAEFSIARAELSVARGDFARVDAVLTETQRRLAEAGAQLERAHAERAETEATLAQAHAEHLEHLAARDAERAAAESALRAERLDWQATLGRANAERAAMEAALRAELAEREGTLAQARADLAERKAALEQVRMELAETEAALRQARADLTQANDHLAQRSVALAETRSRLAFRESPKGWLRFPLAWLRLHLRRTD